MAQPQASSMGCNPTPFPQRYLPASLPQPPRPFRIGHWPAANLRSPPICMANGNAQKKSGGSAHDCEFQLEAAAEQAEPASRFEIPEYNRARPEGLGLGLRLQHSSFCLQPLPVSDWGGENLRQEL